jgi:hypothetical protein
MGAYFSSNFYEHISNKLINFAENVTKRKTSSVQSLF